MELQVTDIVILSGEGNTAGPAPLQRDSVLLQRDSVVRQSEFQLGGIIPYVNKPGTALIEMMPSSSQGSLYGYRTRAQGQPLPEGLLNRDFSFCVLTASFVLLILLLAFARKTITSGFLSLLIKRQHETPSHTSSVIITWPPLAQSLFTLLNVSLFVAIAAVHTGILSPMPGGEMIKNTAICLAAFAGILVLRHLVCIIAAAVTGQKKLFMEYVSVVYNTWFIAAVFYFALSSVIVFVHLKTPVVVIYAGAVVTVLLLFLRTIRLLNIFIIRRVPILYFILYLCALEVLPVLIVLKFLDAF